MVFLAHKGGKWKKQKQRSEKLYSGKSKFRQTHKGKTEVIEKFPFEFSEWRYSIMFALRSKLQGINDICFTVHCLYMVSVMKDQENLDELHCTQAAK